MLYLSYFSLFFAAIGQSVFFTPLTEHRLPNWLTVVIALLPCFVVFTIHLCNRPLFSFTVHHRVWLVALCWFAALTIAAELLRFFGLLPPTRHDSDIFARITMHLGWLSFIPLIHSYIIYGRPSEPNRNA